MSGERVGRSERQQNDGNDGALRVSKIVKLINLLGVNERKGERWTRNQHDRSKNERTRESVGVMLGWPSRQGTGGWSFPPIGTC